MIQAPRGTQDVYGKQMEIWAAAEKHMREITMAYGFSEIRVPIFEHTELFLRGVGDTTDIVQKEMYTFEDKGGRSLSLRPEQTAGTARAYIERGMHNNPMPVKLFYIGPNFRYERPAAGRFRQHYQFGIECFGAPSHTAEAEIISLGWLLLQRLGISDITLHINSIGCPTCRKAYHQKLKNFLNEKAANLCGLCATRLDKNPLRTLDCKNPTCKELLENAPSVLDSLDDDCRAHFEGLKTLLTTMEIPFIIDPRVVRGLDYYTRTVFEFINDGLTVIGGGRYDGLIEEVGGTPTPGVGFGMGMERLALLIEKQNAAPLPDNSPTLFIGSLGEAAQTRAAAIAFTLRQAGISTQTDLLTRSAKAQMKYADKIKARHTLILGETELTTNTAALKNMQTGEQTTINLNDIAKHL